MVASRSKKSLISGFYRRQQNRIANDNLFLAQRIENTKSRLSKDNKLSYPQKNTLKSRDGRYEGRKFSANHHLKKSKKLSFSISQLPRLQRPSLKKMGSSMVNLLNKSKKRQKRKRRIRQELLSTRYRKYTKQKVTPKPATTRTSRAPSEKSNVASSGPSVPEETLQLPVNELSTRKPRSAKKRVTMAMRALGRKFTHIDRNKGIVLEVVLNFISAGNPPAL